MLRFVYFFLYGLLNLYAIMRTINWINNSHNTVDLRKLRVPLAIIMSLLGSTVILAFYLQRSGTHRFIPWLSSHWLGVFFYTIFYIAIADLIWLLLRLIKKDPKGLLIRSRFIFRSGLVVLALILGTSIYGFIHMRNMKTTEYAITINKEVEGLDKMRIALVADLHMGYTIGVKDVTKMVEKINASNPDMVVFAGDIFNNNFDALDDKDGIFAEFSKIKSTYGTYACWGNHDIEEPLFSGFSVASRSEAFRDPRMDEYLEMAGFHLLEDQEMLIDNKFYVIGRLDYKKPGDGSSYRKSIEELVARVDTEKPVILIDHQPREFDEIAATGVDLDLSGHTHAGQIFPLNLTDGLTWENEYGLLKRGQLISIVTSGVGVYGLAMRVMTDSEVAIIDVSFEK